MAAEEHTTVTVQSIYDVPRTWGFRHTAARDYRRLFRFYIRNKIPRLRRLRLRQYTVETKYNAEGEPIYTWLMDPFGREIAHWDRSK